MKYTTVTVRYGELRSSGYPNFSNKRIEVEIGAQLVPGEFPSKVKDKLLGHTMDSVKRAFGDVISDTMDIPF